MQEREFTGEALTDGIWKNVPIDVYHSDCCDGPSVSSSGLRDIAPPEGCPLKYWDNSYLNADRAPQDQKPHFNLGKAVHTLLLGESGFQDQYAVRPADFKDWRTSASKDWREEQVDAGKIVLVPENLEQIEGMANRVANDQTFVDHLRGKVERTLVARDPETGIYLKARPDNLPEDNFSADLKTTADASDRAVLLSIKKFNYHMQAALTEQVAKLLGMTVTNHVLLFIETKRPYAYNIKPIDTQYIWFGMRQNMAAIQILRDGLATKYWPTYFGSGITACPTEYFEKQIENEPSIPGDIR